MGRTPRLTEVFRMREASIDWKKFDSDPHAGTKRSGGTDYSQGWTKVDKATGKPVAPSNKTGRRCCPGCDWPKSDYNCVPGAHTGLGICNLKVDSGTKGRWVTGDVYKGWKKLGPLHWSDDVLGGTGGDPAVVDQLDSRDADYQEIEQQMRDFGLKHGVK